MSGSAGRAKARRSNDRGDGPGSLLCFWKVGDGAIAELVIGN